MLLGVFVSFFFTYSELITSGQKLDNRAISVEAACGEREINATVTVRCMCVSQCVPASGP